MRKIEWHDWGSINYHAFRSGNLTGTVTGTFSGKFTWALYEHGYMALRANSLLDTPEAARAACEAGIQELLVKKSKPLARAIFAAEHRAEAEKRGEANDADRILGIMWDRPEFAKDRASAEQRALSYVEEM
jgi:hypothetical protein